MARIQSFNQEPDSLARQDNHWTVYYNKAGVHCHRLIEDFSFYSVLVLFLQLITAPPMVTVASKVYVGREQAASLICEVKGNPTPTISWSPCYGRNVICNEQYFNISNSLKCLNNLVHALGNCSILLWIWFYIIKSILINRSFLDFFSSVPWGICCVNFSLMWSFYQGTASAPSTTEPTSAATLGIGENLFSSSIHVVSWDPYSQLHLPTSIKKYG